MHGGMHAFALLLFGNAAPCERQRLASEYNTSSRLSTQKYSYQDVSHNNDIEKETAIPTSLSDREQCLLLFSCALS